MNCTRYQAIILFAVLIAAFGYADGLSLSFDYSTVYMKAGSNAGVIAHIENTSEEKVCFEVYTYSRSEGLKAEPSVKAMCLNAGESTQFSIALISSRNAGDGRHCAIVELLYNGVSLREQIAVEVETIHSIDLWIPDSTVICNEGYTKKIPIDIINLGNDAQTVYLSAESELFAPFFDEPKIRVLGDSTKRVELAININETTQNGTYKINVYARTDAEYVQREVSFRIKDCRERQFSVSVPSRLDIQKGSERTIYARITNLADGGIKVKANVIGDLIAESDYETELGAGQEKSIRITIKAREDEKGGMHELKFYAWNEKQSEERNIDVYVAREHKIGISVMNKVKIAACDISRGTIEIRLSNQGDFNEDISLKTSSLPNGMQAVFSERNFRLDSGASKTVYLTLHASYGAALGKKSVQLIAEASGKRFEEDLEFEVVEAPESGDKKTGVLQIVNYPKEMRIDKGTEKQIEITLFNNSDENINIVDVSAQGEPTGIYVFFAQGSIEPRKSATLKGRITAGDSVNEGTYDFKLIAETSKFISSEDVTVKVVDKEQAGQSNAGSAGLLDSDNGFFAGLVSLGALLPTIGGEATIIIVTLLLILIILYLLLKRDKSYNNHWAFIKSRHGS